MTILKHPPVISIMIITLIAIAVVAYVAMNLPAKASQTHKIEYSPFICSYEKDHNPPISPEAKDYYQQAIALDKGSCLPSEQLQAVEQNYLKAIELNNWKAMNNLASLYLKGKYSQEDLQNGNALKNNPTGIKPNRKAALELYAKMIALKVPQGYYNWYIAIGRGWVAKPEANDGHLALMEAVRLGSPLAQVTIMLMD